MTAGRPTTYDTAIDLEEAKAVNGPLVYGLCRTGSFDVFYIGSTKNPRKRFQAYAKGLAHGNAKLAEALSQPFKVLMFTLNSDDIRAEEMLLIGKFSEQLVNIIKAKRDYFGHSKGQTASGRFLKEYRNRFKGARSDAFRAGVKSALKAMNASERHAAEQRFASLMGV